MSKAAIVVSIILFTSIFLGGASGFLGGDLPEKNNPVDFTIKHTSDILKITPENFDENKSLKRYLIFGTGSPESVESLVNNSVYTVNSQNGFFSVGVLSENDVPKLQSRGFNVIEDFHLDFHDINESSETLNVSTVSKIVGSDESQKKYNYTGAGIKIAIVDSGVDFSNPDVQHSLARDNENKPIMLDADGQGIILTNATFVANIDEYNIIRNYSKPISENYTSSVYKTRDGVFLDIVQGGDETIVQVYNSFFPQFGNSPVFNGTLSDDLKIGTDNRNYILSQSGIYHLGIIYQGSTQGPLAGLQVVPVLVVDSSIPGVYDTIIPDLSTSWEDFTKNDLKNGEKPNYDFDFTDETQIKLGDGNEFLIYDFDDDGIFDYSAGAVGAQVVDVFGVLGDKSKIDKQLKAINGTLLPAMDPAGEFFGVMTDNVGHGTSSAATITSKGLQEYDIYNNTKKFTIKGVAPDAKIVPIKALWFGDTVYAWLWAAGFSNEENKWIFQGTPRVDIISNSWGVSNFPSLEFAPGYDVLSLILSVLSIPQSIDENYPGVLMVSSAGNSGHGYGTVGLPTSPYGISVGATTSNVFVGYGPFKDQPRFGNTTVHENHVVDFSSKGPGLFGDPKPDLMGTGAHSFTPSTVTKMKKDSDKESFSMFGGTSMAAPIVSGSAAILMQSMNENFEEHDPLRVKNILLSSASDLQNDPFTQGAGLVNALDAVRFVNGEEGSFIVYNDESLSNARTILEGPINSINSSYIGFEKFEIPAKKLPSTSWFGGHLLAGEHSTTTFTLENPSDTILDIEITPQTLTKIKKTQFNGTTKVQQQDPILNKSGTYSPNYVRLLDVKQHDTLASFFDDEDPIPTDASLMILNLNFPFSTFMNKTNDIYADDIGISSLYLYDWNDKNNDNIVSSDELSMITRGGSWGTVQEIRVSDPNTKFENTPLVGIYPVPTRYSYWIGDTRNNSTSMDYTLSASYYKKDNWDPIWIDNNVIQIPPKEKSEVTASIVTPTDYQSGIYQGFLSFEGEKHSANVPVSFVVKEKVNERDSLVMIGNSESEDALYGSGYVKGAFDMTNRYMSGDWRQYYFDVDDSRINTAALEFSWEHKDTSLSIFVIDPLGRIVQTNAPSGVFGHFQNWPTNDWLGVSPFSQGGGFFPINNKDETSTVLFAPLNQTGTYGILVHSTLFGGESITEQIHLAAKFSTVLFDDEDPQIVLTIPEYINSSFEISPQIIDENLDTSKFYLDGNEIDVNESNILNSELSEGLHSLKIIVVDSVENNSTKTFDFIIDDTLPELSIQSPKNLTVVSKPFSIEYSVSDLNLPESKFSSILLPTGEHIQDVTQATVDTQLLENGQYEIQIWAKDKAENTIKQVILFSVDHSRTSLIPDVFTEIEIIENSTLLILVIIFGNMIGLGIFLFVTKKIRIFPKIMKQSL